MFHIADDSKMFKVIDCNKDQMIDCDKDQIYFHGDFIKLESSLESVQSDGFQHQKMQDHENY